MKKNSSGYYEKRIDIGRDPTTGKRIRKAIRARSLRELDRKIFEYKQDLNARADHPGGDITFEAYAKRWMLTKAAASIATQRMYADILDRYVLPELGEMFFSEINLEVLQSIINKNFQHANTCNKIKLTLRQIFEMAEDEDVPNARIKLKRLGLPKAKPVIEKRPLTDEEKTAIHAAPFSDMEKAFVYILYYTGMRKEEALALLPSDFDFKNMTVKVSRVLVYDGNDAVINEGMAKNKYSLRTIPLPDAAVPLLKDYVQNCDGYLFCQVKGKGLMSKTSYNKFWKRIRKALLPLAPSADTLTAHIFRHNYATMLYYSGVTPKMAAKLMGHKDTTMILKIYAHLDEQKEMAAVKLNNVFS